MATAPTKFRIDVGIQNLLQNSNGGKPIPVVPKALSLPKPVFPQYPDKLSDPVPTSRPRGTGNGVYIRSIVRCEAGFTPTLDRGSCLVTSTR